MQMERVAVVVPSGITGSSSGSNKSISRSSIDDDSDSDENGNVIAMIVKNDIGGTVVEDGTNRNRRSRVYRTLVRVQLDSDPKHFCHSIKGLADCRRSNSSCL